MSRAIRIMIGAAIGAAIAFFFGTERGRRMRDQAERQVLPHLKESGGWILDEISGAEETTEETGEALQEKIEAIRKRVQEQQATHQDA